MAAMDRYAGDPLMALREYRRLAPWSLRDLAALGGAILEVAGVRPLNAVASSRPSERTIRFYVTRGLVTPPDGRGTAATYGYRHLLQVLAIKLRQMEGGALNLIQTELGELTGDALERRVAAALGPGVPEPDALPLDTRRTPPRGRSGQLWQRREAAAVGTAPARLNTGSWRRLEVVEGVELHFRDDHPLSRLHGRESEISEVVRVALGRVLASRPPVASLTPSATGRPTPVPS